MKTSIFLAAICMALLSCGEEPQELCAPNPQWIEVNLPDSVDFGRTVVYLNGEEVNYSPRFVYYSVYGSINYGFHQQVDDIVNSFGFARMPLREGGYGLHAENMTQQEGKAFASFEQIVDEDLPGYRYKLEESVGGFINVEHLDSVNQIVRGRFKVAFCRTSTNGYTDLGLPEHLLFQGVFNRKYDQ